MPSNKNDQVTENHYHYHFHLGGETSANDEVLQQISALSQRIDAQNRVLFKEIKMAEHSLQEVVDKVAAETTVDQGIATMVQGLLDKINNTVTGLTPEQQAQINAIGDGVDANLASLQAALTAGTAGLPAPTPGATVPPVVEVNPV